MVFDGCTSFNYDSANRLIKAGKHTYTYNAEDVRIRNLCSDADTTYTYNTNCRLSQLLQKTTNNTTTKYVYGHGLIGEEKEGCFKTYHFDYRGSTVAITDINGNITDTFKYDTYGNLTERTGNSFVIFGYNGRDGVVTDKNGLIYMRARYYSPVMRRFINADIIHGQISDSTSLNRYSYVNGNPVSFVDPFGLSAERGAKSYSIFDISFTDLPFLLASAANGVEFIAGEIKFVVDGDYVNIKGNSQILNNAGITQRRIRKDNLYKYTDIAKYIDGKEIFVEAFPVSAGIASSIKTGKNVLKASDFIGLAGDVIGIGIDTAYEVSKYDSSEDKWIVGGYTVATGAVSAAASAAASASAMLVAAKIGTAIGTSIAPGLGTVAGLIAGVVVGGLVDLFFDKVTKPHIDNIVENN